MAQIDIDIEITDCIIKIATNEKFDTVIERAARNDIEKLKGFDFDWKVEYNDSEKEVYKLRIQGQSEILGLISLSPMHEERAVFVHLIERKDYKGEKLYAGIGGNLFAFACKLSMELDFDGYVSFEAKSNLISHYEKELGAELYGSNLMGINDENALKLVMRYYKEYGNDDVG